MRNIGAIAAIAALAAVACSPSPSSAFGLRIGPFYFGIPFGHRHYHSPRTASLHDDASQTAAIPPQPNAAPQQSAAPQGPLSPLIYPAQALPTVYDQIFAQGSAVSSASPWPFTYDAIFQAAFAKFDSAPACPPPNRQSAVAERIRSTIRPAANQMPQFQKLAGALGFASDYLAKACPTDIPQDPAARLQLMEWQIEKLAEALDFVRPPLQDLQQSLTEAQRARFYAPVAMSAVHPDRPSNFAPACAAAPTRVDASVEQISLAVQPTDDQRVAIDNVRQAFRSAANQLDANCPTAVPVDPLARLEATEARLDATWRALVSIQTALADFETKLTADQRTRFDATDFAAGQ